MKWFTIHWYQYLFGKPYYGWGNLQERFIVVFCRMRGHPSGPIYYTTTGLEPNWSCKDCGEEI